MDSEISAYVDEIMSVLGDEGISREDIEKEFKRFIEFGVPPEQAKRSLIRKFGGKKITRKFLKDVKPNEQSINIVCKIITKNTREINVKGEAKTIYYGMLADETAVLPFTSWRPDFPAEKGDVVEIRNAYSREWQGTVQINIGERTGIKKLDEGDIPNIQQDVKKCKIKDVYSTFGPIEIEAKILSISEKEVETDGTKKKVFSGVLGDDTGKAQFTAWHDFNLKEGDVVRIKGCYAKFWRGIPQIVFDERSTVDKLKEDISVGSLSVPLHKLVEMRGGIDVTTEGTVIEIKENSGYVERCPECNRLIKNGECSVHGKVKGVADLRLKMIVDDGCAGVSAIANREVTEKLIDMNLSDCKKIIKDGGEEELLDIIRKKLLTKKLRLRGNAFGDEFGTTLIIKEAAVVNVDIQREAQQFLQMVEGER